MPAPARYAVRLHSALVTPRACLRPHGSRQSLRCAVPLRSLFAVSPPACHAACLRTRRASPPPPTRAGRAPAGGAYYAPGLSRAVLRKATARASPYADAVRRRIALNVSASVIGWRRFHLPRPLLVCRVPCADVRGSGSAPGDACPLRGCAERTAKTPTVPGARRAVAPFYESGDALHAAGLPRPFGDGGTRHTSTGPPRGRPHFAGRGRLRRPSRPSAFRRPAVALRAVERSPQGGSLPNAAGGPGNAVSPRQVFPPAPPFPGVPPSSKESGRGANLPGGQQHGGLYGAAGGLGPLVARRRAGHKPCRAPPPYGLPDATPPLCPPCADGPRWAGRVGRGRRAAPAVATAPPLHGVRCAHLLDGEAPPRAFE